MDEKKLGDSKQNCDTGPVCEQMLCFDPERQNPAYANPDKAKTVGELKRKKKAEQRQPGYQKPYGEMTVGELKRKQRQVESSIFLDAARRVENPPWGDSIPTMDEFIAYSVEQIFFRQKHF
ncbi:MAG: hypothetical protein FWD58_04555 [Firmicutes bacterium]|nr:hypothetical protein [Bacillota bacterium]